jgi:DNA polymerase-3 subunit gamma/tau
MATAVSLYNKYRPKSFDQLTEQDSIKQILGEELKSGKLKRVLLFTGPAGCGKTTSARIFATDIEPTISNIIEINCADHTGVDDVRQLVIESSKVMPLTGNYKIFILDEVHMLTVQSQNALLKILEEPPAHCIYIMCTTDPQKILGTILSRAFRYDFQLISHKGIVDRLQYVLTQEQQDPNGCGVQGWDLDSLSYIATASAGHMRNALALTDKCISYNKIITVQSVEKVLGVTSYEILFSVLDSILTKNETLLLQSIDSLTKSGMDLKLFVKNFLQFVLDINKYIILKTETNSTAITLTTIPPSYESRLINYNNSHRPILKSLLQKLLELNSSLRWETNVKPVLETDLLLEVI